MNFPQVITCVKQKYKTMKTNILLVVTLLLSGMALGQEECSKIEDLNERIRCLEERNQQLKQDIENEKREKDLIDEKYEREKKVAKPYKLSEKEYSLGTYSEIVIDFSKNAKIVALPKAIKKGDFYRVKVKDINLNLYSVKISSKDSVVTKALVLPTFSDFSLDNLSKLTSNFNDLNVPQQFISQVEADTLLAKNTDNIKEIIEKSIGTAQLKIGFQASKIINLKESWDGLKFTIYEIRLKSLEKVMELSDPPIDFKEALTKAKSLREKSSALKESLATDQKSFFAIVDSPLAKSFLSKDDNKKLSEQVDEVKKTYTQFIAKIDEFKTLISADNLEKLLKTILFINKETTFTSLPIQFKGDTETLSISFVPKDSTSGLQTETLAPLIFPIEKRWYWSVGTSFYYSNLCNDRFSSTAEINDAGNTEYSIQQLESTSEEAGISAMLRVGTKFGDDALVGAHLGFGPGISIEKNIRPRLLFGGGFSIGRKHNLTIDYGGILGYVDRYSDSIQETGLSESPDPLNTEIMVGYYVSLGYMFKL
jgi:hypothetical protein